MRQRILLLAALSAAHGLTMTRSWLTPIYHGRGQTDLIGAWLALSAGRQDLRREVRG